MQMRYRRVVTGHSPDGKAIVASDTEVEPIASGLFPGYELRAIWGADATPAYPDDGSQPKARGWFPPVGGFRFIQLTVAPDDTPAVEGLDEQAEAEALDRAAPGLLPLMEPDNPGFHRTDTVDVVHVVSGSCVMELDDGAMVALNAGDTVVQSGTRHAWRNPGSDPCHIVGMIVGAHRAA